MGDLVFYNQRRVQKLWFDLEKQMFSPLFRKRKVEKIAVVRLLNANIVS